MKTCTRCGEEKPFSEFPHKKSTSRPGEFYYSSPCKTCNYVWVHNWVQGVGRKKVLLLSARKRALRAGVPFTLTEEDFDIPEVCPVFGFPLKVNEGRQGRDSISLDRIDPKLGYVPGNVQIISLLANQMKNEASVEELKIFADWIRKQYDSSASNG